MKNLSHVCARSVSFHIFSQRFAYLAQGPEQSRAEFAPSAPKAGPEKVKKVSEKAKEEMKKGSTEVRQKLAGEVGRSASARAEALRLREAQRENEKQLYYAEHKVGQYRLAPEQIVKVPALGELVEYRAVGGVDRTPFDADKVHDADWFLQHKDIALRFAKLYVAGKVQSNFSTLEGSSATAVLGVLDKIASVQKDAFDPVEFKKKLDSYPRELVYGSNGVFNLLLAFHRADQAVAGRDSGNVLYDLRVGTGKISTRYTILRERLPAPVQSPVKLQEDSNKLREAFIDAVGRSDAHTQYLVDYYNTHGREASDVRELSKDQSRVLHTLTVSGKKFYLRTGMNAGGPYFSFDQTESLNSRHYLDFDAAKLALQKQIDAHLMQIDVKQTVKVEQERKVNEVGFSEGLKQFFLNDKTLQAQSASYRTAEFKGLTIGGVAHMKGADYIISIGDETATHETVYVFVDAANKRVHLKVLASASTLANAPLIDKDIASLSVPELPAKKLDFAKTLGTQLRAIVPGRTIKPGTPVVEKPKVVEAPVEKIPLEITQAEAILSDMDHAAGWQIGKNLNVALAKEKLSNGVRFTMIFGSRDAGRPFEAKANFYITYDAKGKARYSIEDPTSALKSKKGLKKAKNAAPVATYDDLRTGIDAFSKHVESLLAVKDTKEQSFEQNQKESVKNYILDGHIAKIPGLNVSEARAVNATDKTKDFDPEGAPYVLVGKNGAKVFLTPEFRDGEATIRMTVLRNGQVLTPSDDVRVRSGNFEAQKTELDDRLKQLLGSFLQ